MDQCITYLFVAILFDCSVVYLYVHVSICLSVCMFICLRVCLLVYMYVCLYMCLLTCKCVCVFAYVFACVFHCSCVCEYVCLISQFSVRLFRCLFVYLLVCLFIRLFISFFLFVQPAVPSAFQGTQRSHTCGPPVGAEEKVNISYSHWFACIEMPTNHLVFIVFAHKYVKYLKIFCCHCILGIRLCHNPSYFKGQAIRSSP